MASVAILSIAEALPITGAGQTESKATEQVQTDYILYGEVAGATGNVTVDIETSADGINWFTVDTLPVLSAGTPAAKLDVSEHLLPHVRIAYSDTGASTLTARLYYRPSK